MGGSAERGVRGRKPLIIGINVTPLVDVSLVLLIIMMVASTYIVSQTLKVELPRSKSTDGTSSSPNTLTILRDGALRLDGAPVADENLPSRLLQIENEHPGTSLIVSADRDVPHGRVVQCIDAAKLAGIRKFAINVEKRP